MIYFIGAKTGPVKIGESGSAKYRLVALQTANPRKLFILGILKPELEERLKQDARRRQYRPRGRVSIEADIHLMFERDRIRGEWFRRSTKLSAFIAENCRGPS